MIKRLLILAAALLWAAPALAATCSSFPFTLVNGTSADANQVMADFNLVRNCVINNAAASGANSDITELLGLTTAISVSQGGTPVFLGGTSSGSANAQVVTTSLPASFALTPGYVAQFFAGASNTGAMTLAFNGTGAVNVLKVVGGSLVSLVKGDVLQNVQYFAVYDGTQYELLNPSTLGAVAGVTSTDILAVSSTTSTAYDTGVSIANAVRNAVAFVTQGILYATGPTSTSSTAAGVAGTVLTSNGTSSPPSFQANTPSPFTAATTTPTSTTPTANTTSTVPHGLGGAPFGYIAFLINTTSNCDWPVGYATPLSLGDNVPSGPGGVQLSADATNVYVFVSTDGIYILDGHLGGACAITAADWALFVKAWR
jgi:hypothetical protein